MKYICQLAFLSVLLLGSFCSCAQQQVDNDYTPRITQPLFGKGKGPMILIDGGHNNFHSLEDKFKPFGKIAEMTGFRVSSISTPIKRGSLENVRIYVIANALNEKNTNAWQQPVHPAFTADEIKHIKDWVWNGGRLFLIADHMPFPGAVADLAQEMGFTFYDGFALRRPKQNFDLFTFANGMLGHSALTDSHGTIDSIVTFTGQAFKIPKEATSVITLDSNYKILLPDVAWQFSADTRMIPAEGLSQLAYCSYGSGKIVVSGEAAMFTAQRAGEMKFGLNSSLAPNNLQLLLNILEWLNSDSK